MFSLAIDLSGQVFGMLTVVREGGRTKHGNVVWVCKCSCGTVKSIPSGSLRSGHSKSCGCTRAALAAATHTKHGGYKSPEYRVWRSIKTRCTNPNYWDYANYGGRGVRLCKRWGSYELFLKDMGPRPGNGYSIERRDNDRGYSPNNCYWATRKEQANNRRSNKLLTYNGKTATITEWAEKLGLPYFTLRARIDRGWSAKDALETPVRACSLP